MSSEDLCYRCFNELINKGYHITAHTHCHHEPKEKEKERAKCFCCLDGGFIPLYRTSRVYEDVRDSKFCPECGRKLSS